MEFSYKMVPYPKIQRTSISLAIFLYRVASFKLHNFAPPIAMTEHLKGDGGESGSQTVLAEAHTPSSIMSQLSTKHTGSSDMEKEEVRAITGFKVCKIYPGWPSQN